MCFLTFLALDRKMETRCSSFSLSDQLGTKYKPGNEEEEDLLRTCECVLTLPQSIQGDL